MKTQVVPAILAADAKDFQKKLKAFQASFSLVQIDILDGSFGIENHSFYDFKKIKAMRPKTNFELHLMVDKPEPIFRQWLGWSKLERVIIHYETFHKRKEDLYDTIKEIHKARKSVGLAINPNTTVSKVIQFLPMIDEVLVMGVHPGWSGQKIVESSLKKVQQIRGHYPKLDIGFDGGLRMENVQSVVSAGANILNTASIFSKVLESPMELKKIKKQLISLRA